MSLCECGCGEPTLSKRTYRNPDGTRRVSRFRRGHAARLQNWNTKTQRQAARRVISEYNDRTLVDARPVQQIILERFATKSEVARGLGVHPTTIIKWMKQPRMRRSTAELLLRFAAGLPRHPTVSERDLTRRRLERDAKRAERARKREANATMRSA